mmetsp:Transcript_148116/g.369271  ORF Transcript_148116/g.369271 Transcript_148116/m.369271 type:complete len:222 (-) Transcript_148116:42-707(-)
MGSPADWGALADSRDLPQATSKEHHLRDEITAALAARMLGRTVLVAVEPAPPPPASPQRQRGGSTATLPPRAAGDRLVLTNVRTGDRLALTAAGRLGRPTGIHLSAPSATPLGRLAAVSAECDASSGTSHIVLHLEGPRAGPFVARQPLKRRALQSALPALAADEVLACLDGAWEAPPRHEVVVSTEKETAGNGFLPFMTWWPLLPEDWRLAADATAAAVA